MCHGTQPYPQNEQIATVAAIRLTSSPSSFAPPLPSSFRRFQSPAADFDATIALERVSRFKQPTLPASDKRWEFSLNHNHCRATRRTPSGAPLWQLRGTPDFSTVTATLDPDLILQNYGSLESIWDKAFGLTLLGLRLRALGGFMLHSMSASLAGQGILGIGVSRSGKSTLSRLLESRGARVLTDERSALRHLPGQPNPFTIYGTPWVSSTAISRPQSAPLKAIFFPEHSNHNTITPLSPLQALQLLIPSMAVPWQNSAMLEPILATLDLLVQNIPCYRLAFRPTPAVYDTIANQLSAL